nr:hypothetical protein [uncultured Kingella sp.]
MFGLRQRKEWVWRRYAMFCFGLCEGLGQPETELERQRLVANGFKQRMADLPR